MRVAVVTIVSGRHEHLERQHAALARSTRAADDYIVVAMGDAALGGWAPGGAPAPFVVDVPVDGRLPLAAARNRGADLALERGADVVVFLDVDCIPHPQLLDLYAKAAQQHPRSLLTGPVGYLPEGVDYNRPASFDDVAHVHAFRPNPSPGEIDRGRHELFWSLSFAVDRAAWRDLDGFFEGYTGYGGEDTDFGLAADDAGIDLVWVGGAVAYHQFHETQDPPVQHLDDILTNAALFESRWGFWPMRGWLDEFERRGLVGRDAAGLYTRIGVTT
ncbi:glycosyltransferase family 2 protein [Conyzicola sp.]|uniref:glycosyltransferase family 2 protein n=1 Tax=Conyzicola sp. TaxID=1969404 RepID=UPI00398A00C5